MTEDSRGPRRRTPGGPPDDVTVGGETGSHDPVARRDDDAVLTPAEARDVASALSRDAVAGSDSEWAAGASVLASLEGREWLLLDGAARWLRPSSPAQGSTARGWLGPSVDEPSGFVAAVSSLNADGRLRERATRVLGRRSGTLPAAALTVRLLDHVPQVRDAAVEGLAHVLTIEVAEPSLDVVLAGRRRSHGPTALETVLRLLTDEVPVQDVASRLMASPRRHVRRYGFELAHQVGLLTVRRLQDAALQESDQLILAWCADWLEACAGPVDFVPLLSARSVDVRLVALTKAPDDALPDDSLLAYATDRAPRIREAARRRAGPRGLDVPGWYRHQLASPGLSVSARTACLDGLVRVGGSGDLSLFRRELGHASPRVRAAAVVGVGSHAEPRDVAEHLVPLLLDPSARVSAAAARLLARSGAGAPEAAAAWGSPQPWSRRAAWRLTRSRGGWDRVEADLRAAGDRDPHLAALGRSGVENWLATSAATTWQPLEADQRQRIADLMDAWPASVHTRRLLAFHAGLPHNEPETLREPSPRPRWFARVVRRPRP